ncbi:hypothetical protein [Hymenobacter latericus]|uniref:hypothetical protein n=1 Tax=Hymenobacter sp. YIM 151858-1 TaxID=2987688 RepID=UPI0022265F51|nr:hypothetical protein [Hymenobacter sp. YIM 151858-1]UYZ57671.1 hypothetical protein OIS50_11380 [Hymenobacter sp. YIM 151858-1]
MNLRVPSVWLGLAASFLLVSCGNADDDPQPCTAATVLGAHCGSPSGNYGYVLEVPADYPSSVSWTNPATGTNYKHVVTALNLPAELQHPGHKVYFQAHPATNAELAALGARTADCPAPPLLITLEGVSTTPCQ